MAGATNDDVLAGPMPGLSGKGAIVWGGGAGLGLATARLLAASGVRVALADRDADLAERSAGALRTAGHDAVGLPCDVTRPEEVERTVAAARTAIGPVQLSANVVGVAGWKPLIDLTPDEWDREQRRNLRPAFLIGQAVARSLAADALPGSLVFVASVSGLQAAHRHAAYGAAKAAMTALTQSMAAEFGPLGIRANAVAPGALRTERVVASAAMDALLARRLPLGRMGRVEEIAACIAFLLSDLAGYVTGHTLVADGGWMTVPAVSPAENPALPG